jgi:SpoVK/Ycf46/Vps4 family AAA+-type ATPase
LRFLELYLNNTGIRSPAKIIACSPSLLVKWVREFANNFRKELENASELLSDDALPDIIEMDEIYTRIKKRGLQESQYGLRLARKKTHRSNIRTI